MKDKLKVFLACPGVGHVSRGFESFTAELHDALRDHPVIETRLIKGGRSEGQGHIWLPCFQRNGGLAKWIARFLRYWRDEYEVEQISFAFLLILYAGLERPDIIFTSDRQVCTILYSARSKGLLSESKIVFSNGAPYSPPFWYADLVQHLTPVQYSVAMASGEISHKHVILPYGFDLTCFQPKSLETLRSNARRRFAIPENVEVVLSVGLLSKYHKRMDYVIREVASCSDKSILLLVGQRCAETPEVEELGLRLLGSERFKVYTLPHQDMPYALAAADVFVLGSLEEGFARVVVEAIAAGLPVVIHRSPLFEFVAGAGATFGDLTREGELGRLVMQSLRSKQDIQRRIVQNAEAVERYSWQSLLPHYVAMLEGCMFGNT